MHRQVAVIPRSSVAFSEDHLWSDHGFLWRNEQVKFLKYLNPTIFLHQDCEFGLIVRQFEEVLYVAEWLSHVLKSSIKMRRYPLWPDHWMEIGSLGLRVQH